MTVTLATAADVDLSVFRRVAWGGESIEIDPAALTELARRRRQFEAFVEASAGAHLYGITTRHHYGARTVLDDEEAADYARRLPATPASLGPSLSPRLVRGVVLSRVATLLDGHTGVRAETVQAVAKMLDGPLPDVPARGHGDPGEIILLGELFRGLEQEVDFGIGGAMPLVNGSPAAAAMLADATLEGEGRLADARDVFALAAAAVGAPPEHYDPALDQLWADPFQAEALAGFRERLDGQRARRPYQAPVSFRDAPRMLGWLLRLQAQARECAEISLRSVSGNPVYVFPEDRPPHGAILSNGGYRNPLAVPILNGLARAWADLAQLATHQVNRLIEDPDGLLPRETESRITLFYMTATGWAEEARRAAGPTLMSLGGMGQTDTSTQDLMARELAGDAGRGLDVTLAALAIVSAHTIAVCDRPLPSPLRPLATRVLDKLPVGSGAEHFGRALTELAGRLTPAAHPI